MSLERIIVALDFSTKKEIEDIVSKLHGTAKFVKVGMQLYYSLGPSIIDYLKSMDFKIFVDLKIHDIPNTAKGAVQSLGNLNVDLINVHASGGMEMMKAAREALDKFPKETKPHLISVTQLTSTTQEVFNSELKINGNLDDHVLHLAKLTKDAGLDGVVSSALEAKKLSKEFGKDFLIVTPGVRFDLTKTHDQKRVTTPATAFENGATHVVIGREVTLNSEPSKMLTKIAESINF